MAWRTIADSEVDPESPVTTSLAIAWRDNPIAIAQGLSGAERIVYGALALSNDLVQGDIANSAIGQGELKTTTGIVSQTSDGASLLTLPGGQYGFETQVQFDRVDAGTADNFVGAWTGYMTHAGGASESSPTSDTIVPDTNGTIGYAARILLHVNNGGTSTQYHADARQRYVQASPPYDMGDGECGMFIEADVLPNGTITSMYVAPDPVWANNGPTDIRPDWINPKTGKKYKRIRRPAVTRADVDAGRADMADYIAAHREAPVEDVEVDAAFKRSDMDVIPHSWASPPQGTICLLDPVNTHDLLMLHEAGEDVADLIHKGYIQIGDECKRKGPPGVVPVAFKWRNSR